jgi:alkenylglycerophosphocholine/alkenylglycerophosphoethanolamine hydrolase
MSTSQQGTKPSGGISNRVLLAIGLIAAIAYIVGMWAKFPNTVQLITKGIPVLCLIVWLATLPRDRFANLIMAGLIFSLAGDLILQVSKDLFVVGLLSFLVAHLFYIVAFLGVTRRGSWIRLLPFAAWGIIAFLILQPYLGDMLLPVAGYIIVIEVMMWRATALVGAHGKSRDFELAALLGAIAFGLSDTLLALNRFIWHDTLTMFSITEAAPFIPTLTITLYWLAQWGLALAAGWETKDRTRGK